MAKVKWLPLVLIFFFFPFRIEFSKKFVWKMYFLNSLEFSIFLAFRICVFYPIHFRNFYLGFTVQFIWGNLVSPSLIPLWWRLNWNDDKDLNLYFCSWETSGKTMKANQQGLYSHIVLSSIFGLSFARFKIKKICYYQNSL